MIEEIVLNEEDYFDDSLTESHQEFYDEYSETFDYNYNIEDVMLVRITEHFPFGGVVRTPANANARVLEYPKNFSDSIKEIVDNLDVSLGEKEKIKEALKVLISVPRTTIHFCINGLVGGHAFGEFDDKPYVILEPLAKHIDDVHTLRVEDTYFNDNMVLSSEVVLIIRKDIYEKIKDDPRYQEDLSRFKLFIFDGKDEQLAVGVVLNKLGYDSFIVSSNGYVDGYKTNQPAGRMYDFINNYAEVNNIDQTRHFNSELSIDTKLKMNDELIEITKQIVQIMATSLGKSENEIRELNNTIDASFNINTSLITNLINEYGLEKLKLLVSKINQDKINSNNQVIDNININK